MVVERNQRNIPGDRKPLLCNGANGEDWACPRVLCFPGYSRWKLPFYTTPVGKTK